jgi:hypothetical protein
MDFEEIFINLSNEGDEFQSMLNNLTPDQVSRYASLGMYYEATLTVKKLEVELNALKLKIIGEKEGELLNLRTHIEHGLIIKDRIDQCKQAMSDLYLHMKERNWL